MNFLVSWFLPCAVDTLSPSRWMTSQRLETAPESSSSSPAVTAPSPSPWAILVPLSPGRLPLNQRASPSVWSTERVQRHRWSRPRWDPDICIRETCKHNTFSRRQLLMFHFASSSKLVKCLFHWAAWLINILWNLTTCWITLTEGGYNWYVCNNMKTMWQY